MRNILIILLVLILASTLNASIFYQALFVEHEWNKIALCYGTTASVQDTVLFGTSLSYGTEYPESATDSIHVFHFSGLTPNTHYFYRIGKTTPVDGGNFWTMPGSILPDSTYKIVHYSDPHGRVGIDNSRWHGVANAIARENPRLILCTGDVAYGGFAADSVVEQTLIATEMRHYWLAYGTPAFKNCPQLVIPGNHEYTDAYWDTTGYKTGQQKPFLENIPLPDDSLMYLVNFGSVAVIGMHTWSYPPYSSSFMTSFMDTGYWHGLAVGSASSACRNKIRDKMYEYFYQTRNAPYVICMTHEGVFVNSSGGAGLYSVNSRFASMIDSSEASNVSLWVGGHYTNCTMVNRNGNYYIDNHGAGPYNTTWDSSWVVYADTTVGGTTGRPSFFVINVTAENMTVFPVDTNNVAFGATFTIPARTNNQRRIGTFFGR